MPPARLAPLSLLRIIARLRAQAHRQFHIRRHPMERGCGRSATNRVARVLALLGHSQEVFYVQMRARYHPSRWRPGRHLGWRQLERGSRLGPTAPVGGYATRFRAVLTSAAGAELKSAVDR